MYVTANDIVGLPGFPGTIQGARKSLRVWASKSEGAKRSRAGSRTIEYHIDCLPANAQKILRDHLAKQLMDDTSALYRQTLFRLTGKTSATKCSLDELKTVIDYMHKAGFPRQHGRRPSVSRDKKTTLRKIEALLADAGRQWAYAESMARHMFNGRQAIEWLTDDELYRLMQALVIDQKRREKRE